MKPLIVTISILLMLLGTGPRCSWARQTIAFGPQETSIDGSIPYTVIGSYKARFRDFKGRIVLDVKPLIIRSVDLEIEVKSLVSNSAWCDKLALSRRLLNAARYPKIIFRSSQIIRDETGYKVKGFLEMHGITRALTFPFDAVIMHDPINKRKVLVLHGTWVLDRKKFNIVWSRYLDHGGVVVGDDLTVSWSIRAAVL